MNVFPALEVSMGPPADHALGDLVPLVAGRRLVLGRDQTRSGDASFLLTFSALNAKHHCEVFDRDGQWWVRDLSSSNGTFVNGRRLSNGQPVALGHGDCVWLPNGTGLRFLVRPPLLAAARERRLAVLETPDDSARWAVWADELLEQSDPLGERILAPDPADDLHWLGPFATQATRGECEVTWAHGLPAHVVLRSHSTFAPELYWGDRVASLARERVFGMLRSLEVDLGSFSEHARVIPADVVRALEHLGTAFPALERLNLGPSSTPVDVRGLGAAWERFRREHPRLVTSLDGLVPVWAPVPGDHLVLIQGHWFAQHANARLNGLPLAQAMVRPGDVLELPGVAPITWGR